MAAVWHEPGHCWRIGDGRSVTFHEWVVRSLRELNRACTAKFAVSLVGSHRGPPQMMDGGSSFQQSGKKTQKGVSTGKGLMELNPKHDFCENGSSNFE